MTPHVRLGGRRSAAHRTRPRVAVVGAGIVGLAHAWAAARRGWQVLLFDRNPRAIGASIRNFGMVWPIGQPNGPLHRTALRSRQLWGELLRDADCWSAECGSLHLAYREDELAVLQEFVRMGPALGYPCELLDAEEVLRRSPAARPDGLLGGLWSATELCVDPREVMERGPHWLHRAYGVELHFGVPIVQTGRHSVVSADQRRWVVDQVVVAAGADLRLLDPELYAQAGFRCCKLQMMRTGPQPEAWRLGPMLAGGLTLRHYASFGVCRSVAALKRRIAAETPELDALGIHVMASQNGLGEIVLGDSHEYGADSSPFDREGIDELILRELRRMISLPDWTIQQRWHGVYVQAPDCVQFTAEPEPEVFVAIASGGCGMTMSLGLADDHWTARFGPPPIGPETSPAAEAISAL